MRFLILAIVFVSTTAFSVTAFAKDTNAVLTKELQAFNDRFNEIVVEKDMDAFLSLYSKEVLWVAPATAPVVGHGEPRNTFQFITSKKGELVHTIDKLMVSDDGTQAVMIGTAFVKVKEVGLDVDGTYLFVMKKEQSEWKIFTDMWHQHTKK
jgi:ketosteroid isomerase-like protein